MDMINKDIISGLNNPPLIIVNNGGLFDLQSALGNMPGFIWSKYPKEKHFYKFPFGSYSYLAHKPR